jgi:hypothetical protein
VNLATARRLGLKLGPKVSVGAVAATRTGYWPVKVCAQTSQIDLSGDYLALDLSELSRACGQRVDGLIGINFFADRVVEIDFTEQKLRLLNESPDSSWTNAVRLEKGKGSFRVPVCVNDGKSQWVRVDTGCATAFQWVSTRAKGNASTSAVGLTSLAIPQTLTDLCIGHHHLDSVPTGLHRRELFPGEAGLLGNGVLATFGVIVLDAKTGRLFLGR